MDVRLSPEQEALRAAAAQAASRLGPHAVDAIDDLERGAALRAAVDGAGWRTLRDAGHDGAPEATGVEVALVAEEFGRCLADVAYLGPVLAAELRRRCGATAARRPETVLLDPTLLLPAVIGAGEVATGVAVDAVDAEWGVLLVQDDAGAARLATVPVHASAVQLDLTRRCGAPDASAAVTHIAGGALGDDDLAAWTALALAVTCADLVGVMSGALELARAYTAERRQFDAPVGSFQAVQHLLADAHVAAEGSRSVALHAAWAVDAVEPQEALYAAAVAKAYCARAACRVCETVVQVHGGIGQTWDCLAHVFLRRALLSTELFGGADTNIDRVLARQGLDVAVGSGRGLR